jgi:ornithine--oxo-acid transaminase
MAYDTISSKTAAIDGYSHVTDEQIYDLETIYGANHYHRLRSVIRKTQGAWLYKDDGTKVLDCLAAYSAANPGHHHPKIVAALVQALQQGYGSVISNVIYTDTRALFLQKLCTMIPQLGLKFGNKGNKALLKNGGVESVETAIKLMRYYGYKQKGIPDGKQEIIVFTSNFHGRMIAVISFSDSKHYKEGFGPLTPGYVTAKFGDIEDVKRLITKNTCGILVEPMQGEGGMFIPPDGFMTDLRALCDQHDMILVADEIQVGLGRTGKDFCFQHEDAVPDAIIIGKAISGGLIPLSGMITNSELMDLVFHPGSDGSTYGGYSLACAAGLAALDVFKEECLTENSAKMGAYLKENILKIAARSSHVKEVRGRGLFIGIEVKNGDAMIYCEKLLRLGMLANDSHHHTIRISPPLIINREEADYILERLEKVLVD